MNRILSHSLFFFGLMLPLAMAFGDAEKKPDFVVDPFEGNFEGELDKGLEVHLLIEEKKPKEPPVAKYYYKKVKADIELDFRGKKDGSFEFEEKTTDGTKGALWVGRMDTSRNLTGTWTSGDGKKSRSFKLKQLSAPSEELFGVLKTQSLQDYPKKFFKVPASLKLIEYQSEFLFRPGNALVYLPTLSKYKDRRVLQSVRKRMEKTLELQGCDPDAAHETGLFVTHSEVTYATHDVYSVYAISSYFCDGAAYPTNHSNQSVVFDLKTGRPIKFSNLFSDFEAKKKEIFQIVFEPFLKTNSQVSVNGISFDSKESDSESCPDKYTLDELLKFDVGGWHVTRQGVVVEPDFPHAVEACIFQSTVSAQKLKAFAKKGSLLERLP